MTPRQTAIELPRLEQRGRADFMASPANETALALFDRWPDWPDRRLALVGPEGSGKSHLASAWAGETGARVVAAHELAETDMPALSEGPLAVEDVDRALSGEAERTLFHLWNALGTAGHGLLLTGRRAPSEWVVRLPDLASRLASLTPARLGEPDEPLLQAVLLKLFADRQIAPRPALVQYLLPRMERSFAAAHTLVDRLDREALAQGRAVDVPVARTLFDDA